MLEHQRATRWGIIMWPATVSDNLRPSVLAALPPYWGFCLWAWLGALTILSVTRLGRPGYISVRT